MENRKELARLNELTCLALGKAAHIEDMLEIIEVQTRDLLADATRLSDQA